MQQPGRTGLLGSPFACLLSKTPGLQRCIFKCPQTISEYESIDGVCTRKTSSPLDMSRALHPLIIVLLCDRLRSQNPFRLAVHILLVLDGNAAKVGENILHVSISLAASRTAEVVDPGHADKQVVHHGNDDSDTHRVSPDNNNGDDAGLCAVVVAGKRIDGIDEVDLLSLRTREPACYELECCA